MTGAGRQLELCSLAAGVGQHSVSIAEQRCREYGVVKHDVDLRALCSICRKDLAGTQSVTLWKKRPEKIRNDPLPDGAAITHMSEQIRIFKLGRNPSRLISNRLQELHRLQSQHESLRAATFDLW